ncbi:hypothetical protein EVAR_44862_1 [Eumeta japonica]|uniref:Centromere/kinetochore protein zw10 homolog n=1 Tax=Eumeta variegata TaxID=151549 RepID=A0A4C1Y8I5_EUMVA|nr:hypothetical protein EVAR_44862_1 [Eumeta japonica]
MGLLSNVLEEAQKADLQDLKMQIREISPRLNDLTERMQILSWSLQENLKDLYLNFTTTESLDEMNYKNKKDGIFSECENISKEVNSLKLNNEFNDEEFANIYSKFEKNFILLKDLCVAAEARKKLMKADHDFRRYNYSEAIISVESLKGELAKIQLEGEAAKALSGLRERTDNQLALYTAQLLNKSLSYGMVNVGVEEDQGYEFEINLKDKSSTWINVDRPLFLPKCVISQNAKQIMEIIMEHVKESLNLPDKYKNQLILYIKDVAVMYQGLVPMKFRVNLELCPLDIDQLPWIEEVYEEFDCAISETMMLMGDLKTNWMHTLPTRMYINAMCTLVETLCQSVLNRLLMNTQEIDEELVFTMAIKIDSMVEDIKLLFEDATELDKRISIWKKFIKMSKVLRAQLLELSDCWNKTKELKQTFTCEEIRQVIKMRFPDDAYRLKILAEIQ